MQAILARALAAWFLLLALAIVNGSLRQAVLAPWLGEQSGHVVSTVLLSVFIPFVAWLVLPWLRMSLLREAWSVGALWLLLTLAFEFLAGHYLFGNSWQKLLADYDLTSGRIWPLVLLSTSLAPVVAFLARR